MELMLKLPTYITNERKSNLLSLLCMGFVSSQVVSLISLVSEENSLCQDVDRSGLVSCIFIT